MNYRPRIIEAEVHHALSAAGAVLIQGPRSCGKTSTAAQIAQSEIRMDLLPDARGVVELAPESVLFGANPRLIDEWQVAPHIWNHVRHDVDSRGSKGLFILTGSAQPADDVTRHTGAGRILRLTMRPMTLSESGYSDGRVAFSEVLNGTQFQPVESGLNFGGAIDAICRGGWPALQSVDVAAALTVNRSYLEDVTRTDFELQIPARNRGRIEKLLQSLARNVGSDISLEKIAQEINADHSGPIKAETVASYVEKLRALMLVEHVDAYSTHLRSRTRVRVSPKRYFVDPSLAVAALGANASQLTMDLQTTGFLFENLVIRDLQVFAQALGGSVSHYRDANGLEVDAIVSAADGRWVAIEIKLGESAVDAAAANLLEFSQKIDTEKTSAPNRLAVITAGSKSYMRKDGVAVIAVGNLGL